MVGRLETNQRNRLRHKKLTGPATNKEVDYDAEDVRRANKLQVNQVPPPGMYNPKPVVGHVKCPIYRRPHQTKVRITSATLDDRGPLNQEDLEFDPDKLHHKIQGYVTIGTKTSRRPLTAGDTYDEDGVRFNYRDIPRISSRYR